MSHPKETRADVLRQYLDRFPAKSLDETHARPGMRVVMNYMLGTGDLAQRVSDADRDLMQYALDTDTPIDWKTYPVAVLMKAGVA
jgi:hypothetical protein